MLKKGLRRSVVLHYFVVVFLTIMIVEVIFMISIQSFYYNNISTLLTNKGSSTQSFIVNFPDVLKDDPIDELARIGKLENADAEIQILDDTGDFLYSSSGFKIEKRHQTSDVLQAINGIQSRWIGSQAGTGEQVMAVSTPLIDEHGQTIYILRYVTSLELTNARISNIILFSILVGIAVLAVVLLISIGLANSIVRPINNITAFSQQMAAGRFDVRVEGEYRYELGELASTMNYMAEEIVRSEKVKNDFISSISHELRTPLTGIKGWTETLESGDFSDPEETKLGMKIIAKETNRLIGLVEELLDFSRLAQKEVRLFKDSVDMVNLLTETQLQLKSKAAQKEVRLTLDVHGVPVSVLGDANRLKQVFLNIIDNALKFSHPQSNIYTHIEFEPKWCVISVRDTGIGIPAEHVAKITDKFYQVNPNGGGTGLGLAITRELVELHGGYLNISSIVGEGTTVSVHLPIDEEQQKLLLESTSCPKDQEI